MQRAAMISKSGTGASPTVGAPAPVFFKPAIQAKLSVNQPGDVHEQEADSMAERVMRMPSGNFQSSFFTSSTPPVQRKCADCEEEEKKLQRKEKNDADVSNSNDLDNYVNYIRTKGDSLSPQLRNFFEPRFGHDFSKVKVHTDTVAAKSAQSINALAYTTGNNIVFNSNQFSPRSESGKKLLAHELTHVVQQSSAGSGSVMRKCDPALFAGRTDPLFFPKEKTIIEVFQGARTLKKNQSEPVAIGVIQQALVDLSIDLGKSGPANNGVDRGYGKDMAKGVEDFQTKNSLPPKGDEIDADTIKCLDQERMNSIPVVSSEIARSDLEIKDESDSSDQNIFFARGNKDVDKKTDATTIHDLITNNPAAEVTPQGFESEDELMEFGPKLAEDRAKNVLKELQDEQTKLKLDAAKQLKFKPAVGKSEDSVGVIDYVATRRVHLEIAGKVAASGKSCKIIPADWKDDHTGPCNKGDNPALEATTVKPALDKAQKLLKKTHDELKKKDKTAKDTVKTWFGSEGLLATVTAKIKIWQDHLDNNLPGKHQCADVCHGACDNTEAYNHDTGSSAMMTVCPLLLDPSNTLEHQALVLAHEAGHGALDLRDIAYDFSRLISVLQNDPVSALKNTDSYIFLIECLNGILSPCVPPPILGDFSGLSASADPKAQDKAKESISWLERWTDWVWQDVNNLYSNVSKSHAEGKWPKDTDSLTLKTLDKHFGISRRASQESPANLGEQVFVGVMNTKLLKLHEQVKGDAKFLLDTTSSDSSWDRQKTPQEISLVEDFFKLGTRARVKTLLKILLTATTDIAVNLEDNYADFIDEQSKTWFVKP